MRSCLNRRVAPHVQVYVESDIGDHRSHGYIITGLNERIEQHNRKRKLRGETRTGNPAKTRYSRWKWLVGSRSICLGKDAKTQPFCSQAISQSRTFQTFWSEPVRRAVILDVSCGRFQPSARTENLQSRPGVSIGREVESGHHGLAESEPERVTVTDPSDAEYRRYSSGDASYAS